MKEVITVVHDTINNNYLMKHDDNWNFIVDIDDLMKKYKTTNIKQAIKFHYGTDDDIISIETLRIENDMDGLK